VFTSGGIIKEYLFEILIGDSACWIDFRVQKVDDFLDFEVVFTFGVVSTD